MLKHFLITLGISLTLFTPGVVKGSESLCSTPVLSRLIKHTITPEDTLESIATQYNLIPVTLIFNNPTLTEESLPVGTEIIIPPINGIIVDVPNQASWQDLAEAYGVRADLLFEVNGCQTLQKQVFIPGITWDPKNLPQLSNYQGLHGYPLPETATIGLGYGWQNKPSQAQRLFHSGVDLLADVNTNVLAAEPGLVVYVGPEGNYGNLIVINHEGGLQTRYAHLNTITVTIGTEVKTGDVIGTVGVSGLPDLNVPHLHFEVRYHTPMGWLAQDPVIHLVQHNKE